MSSLLILFNHTLTKDQEFDAKNTLKIHNFIYPSQEIKSLWANIPEGRESLNCYLEDVKECNKKVYENIKSNQKNYSEKIKVLLSEKTNTPKENPVQTATGNSTAESNDTFPNSNTPESEDKKTNFGSKDL